jgi:cell division protein FtsI (penicillin-binding protein 3)
LEVRILDGSDSNKSESSNLSSEKMRYRRHRSPSKSSRKRTRILLIILELCFVFLIYRLFTIQCVNGNELRVQAENQKHKTISVHSKRGEIYDRKGKQLAISVKSYSLCCDPSNIEKPESVSKSLSPIIGMPDKDILRKLQPDKRFVWLKRQLPDRSAEDIKSFKLKGLDFREEEKRFYPQGSLAAHIVGFVGFDNIGLEGIEKKYDTYMRTKTDEFLTIKDRKGRDLDPHNTSYRQPEPGYDLTLTLDSVIQSVAEKELHSACEKHNAVGGSVIIMNPKTGEILALANYPTYDLNEAFSTPDNAKRNRAMIDLYEPGSVFKIITASAAINENLFNLNDSINCEKGVYRHTKGYSIHDVGSHENLTFREVIEESSNIGTVKIAEHLGRKRLYDYIKAYGFGEKTGVDMNETSGSVKSPSSWTARSMGSIPYGQEISVTAIQMLSAVNAIANDGVMTKPFVVQKINDDRETIAEFSPCSYRTPISAKTAQLMKQILVNAVENGTGQKAKIDGCSVAGKTGTSQKASEDKKGYIPGKYVSSFVGFLPANNPLISMIVIIDEPQDEYLGGTVACPVFKEIATQIMQYLTVGQGICIANIKPTS